MPVYRPRQQTASPSDDLARLDTTIQRALSGQAGRHFTLSSPATFFADHAAPCRKAYPTDEEARREYRSPATGPRGRLEVLDKNVCIAGQFAYQRKPLRLSEINRDPARVAIGAQEISAHAVIERSPGAAHLAVRQGLDLDDVGAEVGKNHRTERAGQRTGQIDDPQIRERTYPATS